MEEREGLSMILERGVLELSDPLDTGVGWGEGKVLALYDVARWRRGMVRGLVNEAVCG